MSPKCNPLLLLVGLVALSPPGVTGELEFAAFPILQSGKDPHAKSRGVQYFEDVIVFNEAKKELLDYMARSEVIRKGSLIVGAHTQIGDISRSCGGLVNRTFSKANLGEFAIGANDCGPSSAGIFQTYFNNHLQWIDALFVEGSSRRWVDDKAGRDFVWSGVYVSALQINNAYFSDRNLLLGGFSIGSRSFSGNPGIINSLTHVAQLPNEQTSLNGTNKNEAEREKSDGRISMSPLPYLGVAALILYLLTAGITYFVISRVMR